MIINERIISYRGKATIDRELELEHDYKLNAVVAVKRTTISPNEDGSVDVVYTVEPIESTITDDQGETFKPKKKSRQSVAMRFHIIGWMRDNMSELEDDEAYQKGMEWLLRDLPQILDWQKKKEESKQ